MGCLHCWVKQCNQCFQSFPPAANNGQHIPSSRATARLTPSLLLSVLPAPDLQASTGLSGTAALLHVQGLKAWSLSNCKSVNHTMSVFTSWRFAASGL